MPRERLCEALVEIGLLLEGLFSDLVRLCAPDLYRHALAPMEECLCLVRSDSGRLLRLSLLAELPGTVCDSLLCLPTAS